MRAYHNCFGQLVPAASEAVHDGLGAICATARDQAVTACGWWGTQQASLSPCLLGPGCSGSQQQAALSAQRKAAGQALAAHKPVR
jgi:hypothetical protein